MPTIRKLPEYVIAQIAAGEVIERPAYAVKELIENAVDAGASEIRISLDEYGLRRITVQDNGSGMCREDLLECFKLHTTSKVRDHDMLSTIHTRGFRGEALASIVAVSDVTISSRVSTEIIGNKIELALGEITTNQATGMPVGTIVSIDNIFHSVPVRKRFITSPQTEYKHMVMTVSEQAVSKPDIRFQLLHGEKVILDVIPETYLERIRAIYGEYTARGLIPVKTVDDYIAITGFISRPQFSHGRSTKRLISINNRPIRDMQLVKAVKRAYGILLDRASDPNIFLQITLPPEYIDVNVHPRKEHVGFVQPTFIYKAVSTAVQKSLSSHNLTYTSLPSIQSMDPMSELLAERKPTRSSAGQILKEQVVPWNNELLGIFQKNADIVQFHNTYLVTQTNQGILLVDQHAAHERVLFEKYKQEFAAQRTPGILKQPIPIYLTESEKVDIEEHLPSLRTLGFAFMIDKYHQYQIVSAPMYLSDRDIARVVKEILQDVVQNIVIQEIDSKSHKMLAYLACRTAVKAGDTLTKKQAKTILRQLESIPDAYTCPHGRPIKFEMHLTEIHRLFRSSR